MQQQMIVNSCGVAPRIEELYNNQNTSLTKKRVIGFYRVGRVGGESRREAEALQVDDGAEPLSELRQGECEVGGGDVVAPVTEHLQDGAAGEVEPVALRATLVHELRHARRQIARLRRSRRRRPSHRRRVDRPLRCRQTTVLAADELSHDAFFFFFDFWFGSKRVIKAL